MLTTIPASIEVVRRAQCQWQQLPIGERLRRIGQIPLGIVRQADALAAAVVRPSASCGEILASEVVPLAEAARYVARKGRRVLARREPAGSDRAWWMGTIDVQQVRQPYGVVLIVGPSNYPLFLPGVQIVQALAAGNGVLVKPAPNCAQVVHNFAEICCAAGIPKDLVCVLPTTVAAAQMAIQAGVDKVVFTGSRESGRDVARQCADSGTPAALELSGCDPVFVLDDADLEQVVRRVAYALQMNGGQTCIAPRRLFATPSTLDKLWPVLKEVLARVQPCSSAAPDDARLSAIQTAQTAIDQALASGARIVCGDSAGRISAHCTEPIVLADVTVDMAVAQIDLFVPVLSLIEVPDVSAALAAAQCSPLALGASVFGSSVTAQRLALSVVAGCVTINDVLVPTADPRVSFGGWQQSGYGATRGPAGLLEMTRLKVICTRRGKWLPHLTTPAKSLTDAMRGIMLLRHGGSLVQRWQGIKFLWKSIRHGS